MASLQRQAGFSKLEFSVVLALMGAMAALALNRLHEVQEIAEKTAVEMTVRNIQSGLRWEMSERIMTKREASIAELAGGNPVRWLEKPPDGYLGEYPAAPDRFPPGTWYFDILDKELRYSPVLTRNLECRECARKRGELVLAWRIERAGNPMLGRGDLVRLLPVVPYRWF